MRSEIGDYYTTSIIIPKDVSEGIINDFNNYMLDYIRKDFISNDNPNIGFYTLHPRNYNELREKGEFLESLKAYISQFSSYKAEINNAIEASNALKNNIEIYLND